MLFTWSSKNLCIIFRQWRITGPVSFLLSLVLIVLLTAGYEGVRQITRKYEAAHNQRLNAFAISTSTGGGMFNPSSFLDECLLYVAVFVWRWHGG
jgi:copper transporter 1